MRFLMVVLSFGILAGCQSPEATAEKGVGFESYAEYQRRREAELISQEQARRQPAATATTPYAAAPATTTYAAPAPVTGAPLSALTAEPAGQTSVAAPAADPSNTGISDEQNFSAVSSRESIESDRARLEQNRAQYQQVEPTALPQRKGASGADLVTYALQATNRVGQSVYKRGGLALANSQRACAGFASPDLAQTEFLRRGGPKRDPKNLDPDGDGFACTWDPTPFQNARGG